MFHARNPLIMEDSKVDVLPTHFSKNATHVVKFDVMTHWQRKNGIPLYRLDFSRKADI